MSFRLEGQKWGSTVRGSASGEVTWSLSLVGLSFSSDFTERDFREAAQDAFDAWENVSGINFRMINGDADIDVEVDPLEGNSVGLASFSFFPGDNGELGRMNEALIEMDQGTDWSPYGTNATVNFFAVLTHEVGHTIGLDHVNDISEIMNPFVDAETLGDGDIEGAQLLYGARKFGSNISETVNLGNNGAPQSDFTVSAKRGNDTVIGGSGNDRLFGGAGNDTLRGQSGRDILIDTLGTNNLFGDNGSDLLIGGIGRLTAQGGNDSDIIIGGIGDDILSGGGGNDTLRGDPRGSFFFGEDTLIAGAGTDNMEGGQGADTFRFTPNNGQNYIASLSINQGNAGSTRRTGSDFESGIDTIDLNGFGYRSARDAFSNVDEIRGTAVFSDQGTTIEFTGLGLSDLSAGDFII